MGQNVTYKILQDHLVDGELKQGTEIGIRIDQTLTQDATGTMAYLQFEAMGVPRVRTKRSVSYIDHNMLQTGFENADDHRFLQSIAAKFGAYFSRPGNGICHQVHLERFAVPGQTLLGSDSHTPTGGGMGMIAIGAGGLDVAVAMSGGAFYVPMPRVLGIHLTGKLQPWVTAKDVILEILRRLSVKGGVGKIVEYFGPGVASLTVPERGTITNMGAELGATTSVFPSDEQTLRYLKAQSREESWVELIADPDAGYDETIEVNLDELEPMIAQPSMPDRVVPVREVAGLKIAQACVGSCTNSSYLDLMHAASVVRGRTVNPGVSMTLSPGSKQVYTMISENGTLPDFIQAGARVLESGCGPCIGMGQSPPTGTITLRTFNRNFSERTGTPGDQSYLCSPEVASVSAITGVITDPRDFGEYPQVTLPETFIVNDNMVVQPPEDGTTVEVVRGPNIKPVPIGKDMPDTLTGENLLKVEDNITTDHIMPAGAKILPLRSNIPAIAEYVYFQVDPTFAQRAKEKGGGFIVGGENYGQGSSREHAALAPMYLGLKAVVAKSFARIHWNNLINFGILPLVFVNPDDYDRVDQGDQLEIRDTRQAIQSGTAVTLHNKTKNIEIPLQHTLTPRQIGIMLDGGLLNHIRKQQ